MAESLKMTTGDVVSAEGQNTPWFVGQQDVQNGTEARRRKIRSDKGKKREPSDWIKLVKAVCRIMKVSSVGTPWYTWEDFD